MFTSALIITASLFAQTPDQAHIFKSADGRPNVALVLDVSGSMGWDAATTSCDWYWDHASADGFLHWASAGAGKPNLVKIDQLKAALTGCADPGDGMFDKWAGQVTFSVRQFAGGVALDPAVAEFGASRAVLEASVEGLGTYGNTPLTPAHSRAARHLHDYFDSGNTKDCRQNFIVLMTDGIGNTMADFARYDYECSGAETSVDETCASTTDPYCVVPENPAHGARYIHHKQDGTPADILCDAGLPAPQPIVTYTIGFGTNSFSAAALDQTAELGGGKFFSATNYQTLDNAFSEIVSDIVARSSVNFTSGSIQTDGISQGNFIYVSSFAPHDPGAWRGTTKKYEIFPFDTQGNLDPSDNTTLFVVDPTDPDHKRLLTNPQARDLWTESSTRSATDGGTGQQMLEDFFDGASAGDAPPSGNPWRRTILTWRPMEPFLDYVAFHPTTLGREDTWSANTCEHMKLVNYVHGYTYDVDDCANCRTTADPGCAPAAVDWPTGAPMDSPNVLLQYDKDCEGGAGRCFLAVGDNRGLLHFYDTFNGTELSALLPGEFLRPTPGLPETARNYLRDVVDQPTTDTPIRFYVDGGMRLFHDDQNSNGVIDTVGAVPENAYLIVGLGRGGSEAFMLPVRAGSQLALTGVPDKDTNPVRVLASYAEVPGATPFGDLQETWASPVVSEAIFGGDVHQVLAFASGHQAYLDAPAEPFGVLPQGAKPPLSTPTPIPASPTGCKNLLQSNGYSTFLGCDPVGEIFGASVPTCQHCTDQVFGCPTNTHPPCYDWFGYGPSPYNVVAGPLRWTDGTKTAVAFRFYFEQFDLQDGDCVRILNHAQHVVQELCGQRPPQWSEWVYDSEVYVQIQTDGEDDSTRYGYRVGDVEVITRDSASVATTTPSIYVMDANVWASSTGTHPHRDALLLRVTSDCRGMTTGCIDHTTSPDLVAMVFPISSELSAYTEGGLLRALYFGDEGGQIWRVQQDLSSGEWTAKRIARLNNGDVTTLGGKASKDYRKIFTKLDLVISSCTGRRAVGVYFGTGNVQRPGSFDDLEDVDVSGSSNALSECSNVIGVVWDTDELPVGGATLDNMANVTLSAKIPSPTTPGPHQLGYFIELFPNEKMLRAPLVFEGTAYFKTFQPVSNASECLSADGTERIYAFDNCTAEAKIDADADLAKEVEERVASSAPSDIGGGFALFTNAKLEQSFVSTADNSSAQPAALVQTPRRQRVRLLMWRSI